MVRQNFSRGPKRGGSGGIGVNTMIDSVQQEDPKRASPVRVERVYKGPAESRSELCRSIEERGAGNWPRQCGILTLESTTAHCPVLRKTSVCIRKYATFSQTTLTYSAAEQAEDRTAAPIVAPLL